MNEKKPQGYSVLMSVYEKENPVFLKQSIESMKGQTLPFSDFVLVCDGPLGEDLNQVIREEKRLLGSRLQVIPLPENQGLGRALMAGLSHCRCPFVARMDSDDISRPARCEKEMKKLQEGFHLVGSAVREFDQVPGDTGRTRILPETNREIRSFARKRNPMNHGTVMFRKDKVTEAGGYRDCPGFEDYNLWIRMLKEGCRAYNCQEVLVDMRIGNGLSGRRGGLSYIRQIAAFQLFLLREKVISPVEFAGNCILRAGVALMPDRLRDLFYRVFLRKKAAR